MRCGESIPGRGNSRGKASEIISHLVCLRDGKANVYAVWTARTGVGLN